MTISRTLAKEMISAGEGSPHSEVCGLLFGDDDRIAGWRQTDNIADDRSRAFEVDGAELFAAIRIERSGGPRLIGHVHSHPNGNSTPSPRDAAMAGEAGQIWLIVASGSLAAWGVREGGKVHDRFDPIELVIYP